jgi:cell pole-organizing protein PopZ
MSGVFSRRSAQPPKPPAPPPAAAPAEADPSMEDILASIRRILNEGDGETAVAPAEVAPAAPAPAPVVAPAAPEPVATVQPHVEVEQQNASQPPAESVKPDDVFILEPAMMVSENASTTEVDPNPIASTETVAAASQSVGALKKALSERQAQIYKASAVSLEEIVREEVRPMLKDWLDAHLPAIVERLVRAEIERVVAREIL